MVVDRGLRLVGARALRASVWSFPKPVSRTLVAIHSCSALVCSRHAPWERMSLELAQHASIAANSVAHGVVAAAFLGRTLSLSTFIARRKILGGGGDRRPRIGPRGTPSHLSGVVARDESGFLTPSTMVRNRVATAQPRADPVQSDKGTSSQQPLSQAQLAALASRNSSAMRYVGARCEKSLTQQAPPAAAGGKQAAQRARRRRRRQLEHHAPAVHGRQQGP